MICQVDGNINRFSQIGHNRNKVAFAPKCITFKGRTYEEAEKRLQEPIFMPRAEWLRCVAAKRQARFKYDAAFIEDFVGRSMKRYTNPMSLLL